MKEVTVNKKKLLAILKKNLARHELLYQESLHGFKAKFIEALEIVGNRAIQGDFDITPITNLQKPADYSEDYKDVIKMIEMEIKNNITLTQEEFENYVLNKWDWISSFKRSYLFYSSSSSSRNSSSSSSTTRSNEGWVNDYFGE